MNKLELIDTLKNECGLSKKDASAVVELFFDNMSDALARGDRVEIRGLCSFYVKEYQSYKGRNPRTGEAKAFRWLPKNFRFLSAVKN
jgi:integration host factor subunit beta